MIKKENLEKTSAWPFVEAKKLLRERKSIIEKKGKITLQTGYGPSGLPHIGTFGEVARTSMMVNALKHLTDLPTEILTFSDDMDGLRKVPENVPNKELLEENLHKPLTQVPDPFKKFKSFGEHNNEMLKDFLNNFKFIYNFKSSTKLYKSGFFNSSFSCDIRCVSCLKRSLSFRTATNSLIKNSRSSSCVLNCAFNVALSCVNC